MRRRILIGIAACFYYSGLVALARWYARRRGRRLIILNYHRATGGDLRRHLLYLRRHYRIMHAEEALEALYARCEDSPGRCLPLVLTFDDGYRDNYTHAYALARELQIPMTIYLIPGYIETGDCFWWLAGARLTGRARVQEAVIEGRKYSLDSERERAALARMIDAHVRRAPSVAQREAFLACVRHTLAVPEPAPGEAAPELPLTWEQVREMARSEWISFGAHTMHHPVLSCLSDPQEMQREIAECRAVLEQRLGYPVRSFAYPIGQRQHIGAGVVQAVRRAGYDWALTTSYGLNTPRSDPYLLSRIEVDVGQHWLVMAVETAGLWGFFARLRWLPFVRRYFTNAQEG